MVWPNFVEVRALISNYILLLYVDVITYASPKLDASVAYLCQLKNPSGVSYLEKADMPECDYLGIIPDCIVLFY